MSRRVLQNESLTTVGLLALMLGPVYSTHAQESAPAVSDDEPLEEVTVTGSSLRGAPAVGSNLISLDAVSIEENAVSSVQQILQSVPQVWGSNAAGPGRIRLVRRVGPRRAADPRPRRRQQQQHAGRHRRPSLPADGRPPQPARSELHSAERAPARRSAGRGRILDLRLRRGRGRDQLHHQEAL